MSTFTIRALQSIAFALVVLFLMPGGASAFFGKATGSLVQINDKSYSAEDYRNWWTDWQEPGMAIPESPDEFIDWMLLSQEAEAMQLFENPTFQSKVSVFLKVQSLMMLRQEEVASRIVPPTEAALREIYSGTYSPLLNLRMIAVNSQDDLDKVQALINAQKSLPEAAEQSGLNDPDHYIAETGEMRPVKLPEPVKEIALTLNPGDIAGPVVWNNTTYFFEVLSSREGSADDFKSHEDRLTHKYNKNEESRLTSELVEKLKKKYAVEIDQTVVQSLKVSDLNNIADDRTVLKVGDVSASAGQVLQSAQKQMGMLSLIESEEERFQQSIENVISGMVTQTLLGLESADRHYENKQPIKPRYDFYVQNRLIKELESEIIRPQVSMTDKEVREEYENNPDRYSQKADLVEVMLVDTQSEKLAQVLAEQLKSGQAFETIMKVLAPNGPQKEQKMVNHLSFEIQEALAGLAPGQAAGPITSGDKIHFVKYFGKIDTVLLPFEKAEASIRAHLQTVKFDAAKERYLQRLKENSNIKLNDKVWQKTRKQLLETADDQT